MRNHLSVMGIIHTVFSIIMVLMALYALFSEGRIDLKTNPGKWYIWLTFATCLSLFVVIKTGYLASFHGPSPLVLGILPFGLFAKKTYWFGGMAAYMEVILMLATLFFCMTRVTVETLKRVSIKLPMAYSDQSPIVKIILLIFFLMYRVGITFQIRKIRPEPELNQMIGNFGFYLTV